MHIRSIAVAGALALAGAPALTACAAGRQPAGAAVNAASLPSGGAASSGTSPQGAPGATGNQTVDPTGNQGISDTDLAQIDRELSDASSSLGAADHDAAHDEAGDSTP
jgi:hypothetical protein